MINILISFMAWGDLLFVAFKTHYGNWSNIKTETLSGIDWTAAR